MRIITNPQDHTPFEPLQGPSVIPLELRRSRIVGRKEVPNVLAVIANRGTQKGLQSCRVAGATGRPVISNGVCRSQRFLHPAVALEDFQALVGVQLDSLPWNEAGGEKRSSRPESSRVVFTPYRALARAQALSTTSYNTPTKLGYGQEFDVLGIPEARPVGQQEDTASQTNQRPQTETPAAYRTTSGSDRAPPGAA